MIVARHIVGGVVVDQLVTVESAKPAAEATWSIATSLMTSIATTVIVVGLLFSLAGWLGSPTGSARSTRRVIAPALRDYVPYIYTGLAIVVGIYFISGPTQGLRTFLTTLIVAGMAAFGIFELRKQTAEEFPDAKFNDTFGDTRDKVVSAVKGANIGERASKLRLPEIRRPEADEPSERPTTEAPTTEAPTAVLGNDEDSRLARLERLGGLHEKGILTDEEFAAEKSRVLSEPNS